MLENYPQESVFTFWNNFQQGKAFIIMYSVLSVLKLADLPLMTMGVPDTLVPSSSFKRIKPPDEDLKLN